MFNKIFKWTAGRHTGFAIFFTLSATALAWFHRLDGNYALVITAIQGFVFAHSAQENYFSGQNAGNPAPTTTVPPQGDQPQ